MKYFLKKYCHIGFYILVLSMWNLTIQYIENHKNIISTANLDICTWKKGTKKVELPFHYSLFVVKKYHHNGPNVLGYGRIGNIYYKISCQNSKLWIKFNHHAESIMDSGWTDIMKENCWFGLHKLFSWKWVEQCCMDLTWSSFQASVAYWCNNTTIGYPLILGLLKMKMFPQTCSQSMCTVFRISCPHTSLE